MGGVGRRMRCAILLLALATLLLGGQASPGKKKEFQVLPAIPTQIEEPPAESEEVQNDQEDDGNDGDKDDEGWDVDYIVNRPTSAPEVEEEVDECQRNYEEEGEGDKDCVRAGEDLTPYKKYKSYKRWERRPLFVIIIGGLRWDYLIPDDTDYESQAHTQNPKLKAFNWIKRHGTTMKQVVPVFPPFDLPTWTSLATGLYPQNTGVVGDYMYNLQNKEMFNRDDDMASLDGWWTEGEPIWSVAAKHGRKVSVLNWHDCTLPGKNIEDPGDCEPYDPNDNRRKNRKKELVKLFNRAVTKIHKDDYDLSILYTDSLKKTAKKYGPNSQEVRDELQSIDEVLQGRLSDIKNKKERADLKLNVLLISDYGLNGVNKTTKVVLDEYLNFDHVQYIIQRGGSTVLVPYALKAGDIMAGVGKKLGVSNMVGVFAYVRDINLEVPQLNYPEIPDELRYGGLQWTQDILLVAKPGFQIHIEEDSSKIYPPPNNDLGESGYNPQPPPPYIIPGRAKHKKKEVRAREAKEVALYNQFVHKMKTVGFAWGPDFKSGFTSEPIEIVDIYQIMAFLLKIPPNHHDGQWSRIRQMLMISPAAPTTIPSVLVMLTLALLNFNLA